MSAESEPEERYLAEDERSIELAESEYRDTTLQTKLKGPKVTDDDYRERLIVTRVAQDRGSLAGWQMLQLPADKVALDQFICALILASNELADLDPADGGNQ